jgi:hypothetical protein
VGRFRLYTRKGRFCEGQVCREMQWNETNQSPGRAANADSLVLEQPRLSSAIELNTATDPQYVNGIRLHDCFPGSDRP